MTNIINWKKALLPKDATIHEAICNLNESTLQIVMVINSEQQLIGTITDGDIRRGLLRGISLNSSIEPIIHQHPFVVPPQMPRDRVLDLMQTNLIHSLPIVDEQRRVIGLHSLDRLLTLPQRPNLMIIMAGGKGTRLRPHTENCPKPLLPVQGKPMLEHIIERAKREGFKHFILAVHYLAHMIEDYFGNGEQWHVKIDYLREKSPLGTAGAISLLSTRPNQPFLVSNGDILTDVHYGQMLDFHLRYGATATMAVQLHEWQNPFGVVHTEGINIRRFEEKPVIRSNINAGIYVLSPKALDVLEVNEYCDMPMLFNRVKEQGGSTIVYPIHESWLDIGNIKELERIQYKPE
ncbi:nucleotidyltransferase family protein [Candidatus Synechococcus calcipolaris G9]|uniref:Nucleotidyltransferase family protein n=1 Tax=Candidatus Synechococcus calcipolaris G9 TaxID=1497997 RepID=A0ABT6F3I5_9SYNE|nr:nucleotidyltransferase family protein [Candidatus Synechococcus calcipolaris]MDG2992387.1 nucleotidyltransferase family protein [Candidatus Synechococcus calcipolaris G9]